VREADFGAAAAPVVTSLLPPSATHPLNVLLAAKELIKERLGGPTALLRARAQPRGLTTGDTRLGRENIRGFAVGYKQTDGRFTGELAVRVYVRDKVSGAQAVQDAARIPPWVEVDGRRVATDVVEVGDIVPLGVRDFTRPAPGGSSIGYGPSPVGVTGTMACLVVLSDGKLCLLTNNHVIGDINNAQPGDRIIQPGGADGGQNTDQFRIALFEKCVPLLFDGSDNRVDGAVAWTKWEVASPLMYAPAGNFKLNPEPLVATQGMTVRKVGRTTDTTTGTVTAIAAEFTIGYGNLGAPPFARFVDQIEIQPADGPVFSDHGDSGSLVFDTDTLRPVGLLFSGGTDDSGSSITWANPIAAVKDALGIDRFVSDVEQ
jgi:hypothetical protein